MCMYCIYIYGIPLIDIIICCYIILVGIFKSCIHNIHNIYY